VLIVMRHGATEDEVRRVIAVIEEMGYKPGPCRCAAHGRRPGRQRRAVDASRLEGLPGVQDVIHVTKPYKQVSREWKAENSVVRLPGGVAVGGTEVVAIAGPCSVESERQIIEAARVVKDAGAVILRGGAWKPRTSPYAFQGLGGRGSSCSPRRARRRASSSAPRRWIRRRQLRGRGRGHHPDRRP